MTFTGKEEHHISLDEAKQYTKNFRASAKAPTVKAGYFGRAIFEEILAQPDCTGIRIYFGQKDDGATVLVLVGADTAGKDLYQGTLGDLYVPCPPICDVTSPLYE